MDSSSVGRAVGQELGREEKEVEETSREELMARPLVANVDQPVIG